MSIIGVNGYIGVGKDLVGRIIQALTNPSLILELPENWTWEKEGWRFKNDAVGSEWQIQKYARKLKQIASILTGIPEHKFEDQEFKKQRMSPEWIKDDRKLIGTDEGHMTYRLFLQKLGTDAIRNGLHSETWVNSLFVDYTPLDDAIVGDHLSEQGHVEYEYPKWIITDVRFENEAEAIKKRGGVMIRINRKPKGDWDILKEVMIGKHPSETSLDDWKFDYIINNDEDIESLLMKVREILPDILNKLN